MRAINENEVPSQLKRGPVPNEPETKTPWRVREVGLVTQAELESATLGFGGWSEEALRPFVRSKVTQSVIKRHEVLEQSPDAQNPVDLPA